MKSPRVARSARRSRRGRWLTVVCVFAALVLTLGLALSISTERFVAFGGAPDSATLARMHASPRFVGDHFVNVEPSDVMKASNWESAKHWLLGSEMRAPTCPLPLVTDAAARMAKPPASGLRVTWLGHSTTVIEIDGAVVLTDPIWSERSSPSRWVGPRRFHPPALAIDELPRVDAVVVSHEHYDHLDMATVRTLAARGITFHVPLGIGAHLALWGVPKPQILEHDWWEAMSIGPVELMSTPSRHFSGRGVPGRVGVAWTSWSIIGPHHRVFFSGDTGLTESFREIAARAGPFDVALLEIGQFHADWGDIHLGPHGALDAHVMLRAKSLFPIHWATFELAYHAWSEPAETLVVEAAKRGISVTTPRIGEPIEPTESPATTPWWRAFPPIAERCP